tara:strand:+ start:3086 stop:5242 length:2157 start_codon:yes stop_codon:yes gene_type:complete
VIPPGEGRQTYESTALAWKIQNLETTLDGTLKSVTGPAALRITRRVEGLNAGDVAAAGAPTTQYWNTGRPHSIFHAGLQSGSASILLYRFGSKLYRFLGSHGGSAAPADEVILTGLSDPAVPLYPDQYVTMNGQVIWTNGVDRAQIITYDGTAGDLGYSKKPSAPQVFHPAKPSFEQSFLYFPNAWGYSWPGRIGTPGDILAGREGALLAGRWYYYVQYEDSYGNLSAFSARSEAVQLSSNQADPFSGATDKKDVSNQEGSEIDDLTRRFLLKTAGDAPSQTAAVHVYRTPDTFHVDATPRFLARIPGKSQVVFDDNYSDTELSDPWKPTVDVPIFRVACAHQGRLIIGNIPGDTGLVRRSEPGFAGTFGEAEFVYPDTSGSEITALASHGGLLLAFTESCVYSLSDFANPTPLTRGIGCTAPRSIQSLRNGTLVWLGRDGFYGMTMTGAVTRVSAAIDKVMRREINRSMLRLAVSTVDAETGEYRCALTPAGSIYNRLLLCFDGTFWRRLDMGIHFADLTTTDDWRQYVVGIGTDVEKESDVTLTDGTGTELDFSRVFVLGHETKDYAPPSRQVVYRSAWMKSSADGLTPTNVRSMYIGLLDAWNGTATIRIYRNGSWKRHVAMDDLRLIGPDDGSAIVTDIAGAAVIGAASAHEPRLYWREVPVDIRNANSWAFEVVIEGEPLRDLGRIHIAAFAFDISLASGGSPRGRVPRRNDQ